MLSALRASRAAPLRRRLTTVAGCPTSSVADLVACGGAHFDAVVIGAGIGGAAAALGLTTPSITKVTRKTVSSDPANNISATAMDLSTPANERRRVLVIDAESSFCFHTTGRSAAIFSEVYGSVPVRALSTATKPFFYNPRASGLPGDTPLVVRRPSLYAATRANEAVLQQLYDESVALVPSLRLTTPEDAATLSPWLLAATAGFRARHPGLMPEEDCEGNPVDSVITRVMVETDAADMDVDAIWTSMTRLARCNGASFVPGLAIAEASAPSAGRASWELTLAPAAGGAIAPAPAADAETVRVTADLVVNAAGPWADSVATSLGAAPVGITPCRRTIIQFDPKYVLPQFLEDSPFKGDMDAYAAAACTFSSVFDVADEYYYKAEAGRVLASPCDVTPSEPCDAQPEDIDIAICVDRLSRSSPFVPRCVSEKWAGLRCFADDHEFVIGSDPAARGLFWLAGLGGYGIQSALGNAKLTAGLLGPRAAVPEELADMGFKGEVVSPARFRK